MERSAKIRRIRVPVEWQALVMDQLDGQYSPASRRRYVEGIVIGFMALLTTGAILLPGF